jgi:imidazolonepropionase-like amidohydrolase
MHWTGTVADTPDEVRKAVDVLVSEGADVIKLVSSGGGTKGSPAPHQSSYSTDVLRVGVDAAHAHGRSTVAHARATSSIENCVDAGIDAIAHVEFLAPGEVVHMGGAAAPTGLPMLDQRVAEKLAGSDAWLDLNPQSSGWDAVLALRSRSAHERLSEEERTQLVNLERYFEHFLTVIGGLAALGLADRMGFGSDAGPFSTEFGHLEYNVHLARLAGLSPMASLQAVTRNAAQLCGLDAQVGTLEPGKAADVLLTNGDPLEDPANLTQVTAVFKDGVRIV